MTAEFPSYIRTLAEDMRAAVERYETTAKTRCVEFCPCPMSNALRAAKLFVGAVGLYDDGRIVPGGLPIPNAPPETVDYGLGMEGRCNKCGARSCTGWHRPDPGEAIRCFVCGSDEPMNEHRCKGVGSIIEAAQPECTGFAATWCPIHGDCRCPKEPDGSRNEDEPDGCPLHADDSAHGSTDD